MKNFLKAFSIMFISLFIFSCSSSTSGENNLNNQNNDNNNNNQGGTGDSGNTGPNKPDNDNTGNNVEVVNNKIKLQSFTYELSGNKLTIKPKNDIEINKCDNKKHVWKYIGEGETKFTEIKAAQNPSLDPITVNLAGNKNKYFVYFITQCTVKDKVYNYEYVKSVNMTASNPVFNSIITYEIFDDGVVKTNVDNDPTAGNYTYNWLFDVDFINNKPGPDQKNYKTKEAVSQFNSNGNKYIIINSTKDGFDEDEVAFNVLIENSTAPDIPINPALPLGLKVTKNGYQVNVELIRNDPSKEYFYSKIEVDYGDGEKDTDNYGSKLKFTHRYKNIGNYTIKVVATQRTNMCTGIYCPETQNLEGDVEIVFNKSAVAYVPKDDNIYILFYVNGKSSYVGTGGYHGFRNYDGAFARDFNVEFNSGGTTNVRFCGSNECMTKYKNEGPNSIQDIGGYDNKTGFTDDKGEFLSVPGYMHDRANRLKVSKNGGSISAYFSIIDVSKQGQLMGDTMFARGNVTFNVNKTFDPQTERNIAIFEVNCVSNNDNNNPCTATFKDFEKIK